MDLHEKLHSALAEYETRNNLGALLDSVRAIAKSADLDALIAAAEPLKERPEIAMPIYEHVIAQRPNDARAMVILANAYWLTGRGHDVVGDLAERAKTVDPANRGAWHLWSLSESNNRERMERWRQVSERFPDDKLARAALADNATSLAGAEQDPLALELAIRTYEGLWAEAPNAQQREALEKTLETLRGWKL
jgi:tetratricopeptide (TPR) repeat protein